MGKLLVEAAWKVLLAATIFGAGLPTLFAVGVRAMAAGASGDAEDHAAGTAVAARPGARALGIACFAVVLLVVALGIVFIVATGFGKVLSFAHVYPTITDKP